MTGSPHRVSERDRLGPRFGARRGNAGGSKTRSGFEPRTSPVPPQPPVEQAVDESSDHGFRTIPLAHLLVTAKIPTGAGQCRETQAHRIQCRRVRHRAATIILRNFDAAELREPPIDGVAEPAFHDLAVGELDAPARASLPS